MRVLIADDCNTSWDEKMDFFMYGGIIVPESEMRSLAEQILTLKNGAGIPKERPIKWTNNGWQGNPPLDEVLHAKLKESVLEIFAASGCKIIVCLSPQAFYHQWKASGGKAKMAIDADTQVRTQRYAINDLLGHFDVHLGEVGDVGMVFADRFGTSVKAAMDKHCFDSFPGGNTRIVHSVIQMENEDSHLHQINDVVLGAIYFSLREMGFNFLPIIRDNFRIRTPGDYESIVGVGFNLYPFFSRARYIQAAKNNLREKFIRLVNPV